MSKNVFFSRPGPNCEIYDELIKAINSAQHRILGTAYYLTEPKLIEAINNSKVPTKHFILDHFDTPTNLNDTVKIVLLGELNEIKMHHKFIIIDNQVWTGSFNLTTKARYRNFENIVRLPIDGGYTEEYYAEFKTLFSWGLGSLAWTQNSYTEPHDNSRHMCVLCQVNNNDELIGLCDSDDLINHYCLHISLDRPSNAVSFESLAVNLSYVCRCAKFNFNSNYTCSCCNQSKNPIEMHILEEKTTFNMPLFYPTQDSTTIDLKYICTDCVYDNSIKHSQSVPLKVIL